MATVFSFLCAPTSGGGVLVMTTGGLVSAPRLMLVPAGTRLPSGVHAVVPVQASAVPGAAASGRRRAMPVAAGGEWAYTADDDDQGPDKFFKVFLKTKAYVALGLAQTKLPFTEHLLAESSEIENDLISLVRLNPTGEKKTLVEYTLTLIGALYTIVHYVNMVVPTTRATRPFEINLLGNPSPPPEGTPFITLKGGPFVSFDFGPGNNDKGKMKDAIVRALKLAMAATDVSALLLLTVSKLTMEQMGLGVATGLGGPICVLMEVNG